MPNSITHDAIQQGLIHIPYRVQVGTPNDRFLQSMLFGARPVSGELNAGGSIFFDLRRIGAELPDEALFGGDPNRVNHSTGFKTTQVYPAYYFDEEEIGLEAAEGRVFGEDLATNLSGFERILRRAADKRDAMIASHIMAIEKMCSDMLLTGKVTTREHGAQSMPMTSSMLSVSGANLLTAPIKTLQDAFNAARKVNKAFKPAALIMNPLDALNLMEALDEKYIDRNMFGTASVVFGEIDSDGVTVVGRIAVPGMGMIEVLSYAGSSKSGATVTNYIPEGKAILTPRTVGALGIGRVISGDNGYVSEPVIQAHRTTVAGVGFGDRRKMVIQEQCSCIPLIQAVDGYCVITSIPRSTT